MQDKHPLILAMELKDRAIKSKAHPIIIERLEKLVAEEANKSLQILKKSSLNIVESLTQAKELSLNS